MAHEARTIRTRGAMPRYCLQNIAAQAAFTPVTMAASFMIGRDISSSAAGVALAVGNVLALAVQPWVSSTADGRRGLTIAQLSLGASLGSLVAFAGGLLSPGPVLTMLFVVLLYMFFQNLLALVNSVSVYYINRGARINYGVARGLGSASYACVAAVIGVAAERFGPNAYFLIGAVLSAVVALAMMLLPTPKDVPSLREEDAGDEGRDVSYGEFLRGNRKFLLLMLGTSMAFIMESAVGTYALPIVESVGGGHAEMGFAMALQAILELPGMWGYDLLERRFRTSSLLIFATLMYAVKGLAFCVATDIAMVYVAYGFQMVSFSIWTPASISYANKFFREGNKNKAIGLFSLVFSIAGVVASPLAGLVIDGFGVTAMLVSVTVVAAVGCVLARMGLEREGSAS